MKALSFSLSGSGSSHTPSVLGILAVKKKEKTSAELNRLNKKEGAEMRTCHALLPHAQSAMQPKRMIFVGGVVIIHTFFF